MKLSIVILHHEQPDKLKRIVESISPVSDVEYIVIDDHSVIFKDEARAICEHAGIRYEYLPRWRGVGGARNAGVSLSSGEWIWFVDGDDVITTDGVKSVLGAVRVAKSNIVVLNYNLIGESGDVQLVDFSKIVGLKIWDVGVMAWFKAFKRSMFVPFREECLCEDNDWWLWMIALNRLTSFDVMSGEPVYDYFSKSDGSVTKIINRLKGGELLMPNDAEVNRVYRFLVECNLAILKAAEDIRRSGLDAEFVAYANYMARYYHDLIGGVKWVR